MFTDISFEFDCCHDEFIYEGVMKAETGDRWISYHTDNGKNFLESFGLFPDLHKRVKVSHDKYREVFHKFNIAKNLSGTIGNFYWKNKEHSEHL